jgi:hypothetical protein
MYGPVVAAWRYPLAPVPVRGSRPPGVSRFGHLTMAGWEVETALLRILRRDALLAPRMVPWVPTQRDALPCFLRLGAGLAHAKRAVMNQAEGVPTRDASDEQTLTDPHLAAEIELLGEVIAAAGLHLGPFTGSELDAVLGLGLRPAVVDGGAQACPSRT